MNVHEKHQIIKDCLAAKMPYSKIVALVGCSKGTISYHAHRQGIGRRRISRYDWNSIRLYYDSGKSVTECINRFGFSRGAWDQATKRGLVIARHDITPLEELLVKNPAYSSNNIRYRVLKSGILKQLCYSCGLGNSWNGKPLVLWLDHANGDGNDWRRENLRMVCPNCDSQSETFAGRNVARKNRQAVSISAMH